jgi:hypothetical protein
MCMQLITNCFYTICVHILDYGFLVFLTMHAYTFHFDLWVHPLSMFIYYIFLFFK